MFAIERAKFGFVTICFKLKLSVNLTLWQAEDQGLILLLREKAILALSEAHPARQAVVDTS